MQCLYGGTARWRIARRCSGCLGAASTTNYSESRCAGVRLRLGLLFGGAEHRRAPNLAPSTCKKIFLLQKNHKQTCYYPCRDVFPGATRTFQILTARASSRDAGQLCDYWRAAASASAWLVAVGVRQELSTHQCNRWTAKRERAAFLLVSSQKGEFFCSKAVGVAGR